MENLKVERRFFLNPNFYWTTKNTYWPKYAWKNEIRRYEERKERKGKKERKKRKERKEGKTCQKAFKDKISLIFKTMRNVNSIESKYWKINIIWQNFSNSSKLIHTKLIWKKFHSDVTKIIRSYLTFAEGCFWNWNNFLIKRKVQFLKFSFSMPSYYILNGQPGLAWVFYCQLPTLSLSVSLSLFLLTLNPD